MKGINKSLLFTAIALTLTACGSNSDTTDDGTKDITPPAVEQPPVDKTPVDQPPVVEPPVVEPPTEEKPVVSDTEDYTGKVIDGYVAGATVYLDLNWNGQLDDGEPSAISGARGNYKLALNKEEQGCVPYVPLTVDVPVGAMDEDLGEVTEAYQMVIAPKFAPLEERVANITPLTSVVWQGVAQQLQENGNVSENNCNSIKNNYTKRQQLLKIVEQALNDAIRHYNISKEQILEDYIATGNKDVYEKAQEIVRALKASLKATLKLRKDNPDARFAKVSYLKFSYLDNGDAYPDAWYRQTQMFKEGFSQNEVVKVADDFKTDIRTILYSEKQSQRINGATVSSENVHESRRGDGTPYNCENSEQITYTKDGIQYIIKNLANTKDVASFAECEGDFTRSTTRYIFVSHEKDDIQYGSQFSYYSDGTGFGFLDEFNSFSENADKLNIATLVNYAGALPYQFNETGDPVAKFWNKNRTYSEGTDTIRDSINNRGEWKRRITHDDKTWEQQCSDDKGTTWGACE